MRKKNSDSTGREILRAKLNIPHMDNFKYTIFSENNNLTSHVCFWTSYADDILCLWTGTDTLLNLFL